MDLFPLPAHEALIERRAAELQKFVDAQFASLRLAVEERFSRIRAFHTRSVAQRRRHLRYRQLTGATTE